ncbi:hypothetical protein HY622_02145 [Candidatus Uhrbacteria bacterium]|nr:hypothetical protein [Candidatus Uhrbacteria bacterium]
MSDYAEGITNYIGRAAARAMGKTAGVLDAEEEVPADVANNLITNFANWLKKPVLVKDPIRVGDLAEYFDQNIVSEGSV